MTREQAELAAQRYQAAVAYAYHLDGKLYLLIKHWAGGLYVTHILNESGLPETGGEIGGMKRMELWSPNELVSKGAILVLHRPVPQPVLTQQGVTA